jgi:mono/diheme cytochrome c family protein
MKTFSLSTLFLFMLILSGCSKPQKKVSEMSQEELYARGKMVYVAGCIACHGSDPAKDGSIGPAVSGSSLELLEARLLRATYPEGYTPKRTTNAMVALTHYEPDIPALHVYLNSLK